jgi:hypothetical protein
VNPPGSGPTPLNPRGRGGEPGAAEAGSESRPATPHERSESSISNEAQAVRTLASAHRLAGEIENEARRRADEIMADAELRAQRVEADARARAEATIAEARADRDRIWEQIRTGVGRATRQVGDLLRIREELRLDLREAMRESTSAISRLEEGAAASDLGAGGSSWLPAAPEELTPAPPPSSTAPIAGRASEVGAGSPLSPRQPAAPAVTPAAPSTKPPGQTAPGPAPEVPTAAGPPQGESLSSLRAGPFESFLEVMRFERELAGLHAIEAVYVRRFSNGEVDVEVDTAATGEELAEALRGMPRVAAVQPVGGVLRVRMDAPPEE